MKNQTKRNLAIGTGVVLIVNAALALTGCPEPEKIYIEVPDPTLIYREATIKVDFNSEKVITVEGTLTANEWNGVPAKVKTALDAAYAKAVDKVHLESVFGRRGITIIVTKGLPSGITCKAQNTFTLYLSLDKLDSADLPDKIIDAAERMVSTSTIPYSAQIKKQSRVRFGGGMSPFELV